MDLTFDDYVKECIATSENVRKEDIGRVLRKRDKTIAYLYCRRIAAYVAVSMRESGRCPPTDDTDWIDAIQQCMLAVPELAKGWTEDRGAFTTYASAAFRNVIWRYTWTLAKGGTGTADSGGHIPLEIPPGMEYGDSLNEDMSDAGGYNAAAFVDGLYVGQGLRDPAIEAEAEQEAELAIKSLSIPLSNSKLDGYRAMRCTMNFGTLLD